MTVPDVVVRDLAGDDLTAVTAIYNDVIATSDVIWLDEPVTVDDRLAWFRSLRPDDAALAAVGPDGTVLGYAACFEFRAKSGYWPTVELTIMVHRDHRGSRVGQQLMDELVRRAAAAGRLILVAGIDGANTGSIRFHEHNGFRIVGTMPGVGIRHGRRLDLVLMQRDVIPPDA